MGQGCFTALSLKTCSETAESTPPAPLRAPVLGEVRIPGI